jgi:uncharacterized membrane protein
MQHKSAALWIGVILVVILAACGPVGPALGLGPALDPFVGLIMLVALVLGGGWLVKSVVRSPAGQAIQRQFSETRQAVRNRVHVGTDDRSAKRQYEGAAASHAEETLRERYARGEIDRKQYLETLEDLKSH